MKPHEIIADVWLTHALSGLIKIRHFIEIACELRGDDYSEELVAAVIKEVLLQKAILIWDDLGNVPVDDDGHIDETFLHFPAGTGREEIWHWIEEAFEVSIGNDLLTQGEK